MEYKSIEVKPMAGALGAEIFDVDLSQPLSDNTLAEIKKALLEYLVIVFRAQNITVEQHKAFAHHFGELNIHPFYKSVEGHPEVIELVKEPHHVINNGGAWHSDVTFYEEPPLGSILHLKEIPERGGDTLFANMYAAYEALSPAMQAFLHGLTAIHSTAMSYGPRGIFAQTQGLSGSSVTIDHEGRQAIHPVVRTHPETGRKSLFVNRPYTERINGLSLEESAAVLEFLFQHAVRGEFVTRLRWEQDTIAFWDNRCTQHYALNDYHGMRRAGLRVTVNGDRPV
jgi:taurine dioxygenase